jgi:hypothetical protein
VTAQDVLVMAVSGSHTILQPVPFVENWQNVTTLPKYLIKVTLICDGGEMNEPCTNKPRGGTTCSLCIQKHGIQSVFNQL